MVQAITSLKDLRNLTFSSPIEIQRAGGFFKARWPGRANFVFGATVEEARQRLLNGTPRCSEDSHHNAEVRKRNQVLNGGLRTATRPQPYKGRGVTHPLFSGGDKKQVWRNQA